VGKARKYDQKRDHRSYADGSEDMVNLALTIQKGLFNMLPKDKLSVYTKEHPIPDDAFSGDQAEMVYLDIGDKQNNEYD
jgi:hypothetical protein